MNLLVICFVLAFLVVALLVGLKFALLCIAVGLLVVLGLRLAGVR